MTDLLILRPQPGAAATAALAAARGLTSFVAPLFAVSPVAWQPPSPGDHDALMLTSANAVRHAGAALAHYAGLPVYAVGAATADAAQAVGLQVRHAGSADAADLLAAMAADGKRRPLHLCGAEHRAVARAGIEIERVVVYGSDPVAVLPDAAWAALANNAVALLHSPRAAAVFASLVDDGGQKRRSIRAAAISAAAASALGSGWAAVAIAPLPSDGALLAVAAGLCEMPAASMARGRG